MRHSGGSRSRKVTPPSPTYMTNGEVANYLDNLRTKRLSRPGGARAQPPSSRPLATDRNSISRHSVDVSTTPPSRDATSPPRQHQRASSQSPSIGVASIASRYSTRSVGSHDYYPAQPTAPPLKPSDVVPTAAYMERGQRWMEIEEAHSLRDAMDEMSLRHTVAINNGNGSSKLRNINSNSNSINSSSSGGSGSGSNANHTNITVDDNHGEGRSVARNDATDEDARIYNAALDEAAELVWQHRNGIVPRKPDGPYRYRPHLRKDSYAHARAASVVRDEDERNGRGSATGFHSPTGHLSDDDETATAAAQRNRMSSDSSNVEEQGGKTEPSDNVGTLVSGALGGRTRWDGSGGSRRPFSQGQEASAGTRGSTSSIGVKTSGASARPASASIGIRPSSSFVANRIRSIHTQENQQQTTPTKPLDRVEIYRNPPSRSRNAQYTVNNPQASEPLPQGAHKNGVEIRSDDIRQATSMKMKNRSPNLPEPTAVSDSPGRPIVSFDANWKSPEGSADVSPDRPSTTKSAQPSQPQAAGIPVVAVEEEDDDDAARPRPRAGSNVPLISVEEAEAGAPPRPQINAPSITVVEETPTRPRRDPPTARSTPRDSPSKSSRPLPTPNAASSPGSNNSNQPKGHNLPRPPPPRGHWSPASDAFSRSQTVCHECDTPIEGKFVALAGAPQRFHPHCFRCYTCGISLEAMEITPEPAEARQERLERIRRRAAGEALDETPGATMAEDGDERLRFYCHLDWHELFAPRCKHCKTPILEEHIVALGAHWHFGHFFCAECGDPFEHGMTHIEKDGYAWCINCQTKRTERRAPKCKMCKTAVIGQYIKALGGEWHEHCFRCAECKGSFDDGQIFPKEVEGGSIVLCTKCRSRELKY